MAIEIEMSVEGLQVSAKVKRPRRMRPTVVELHHRHHGVHTLRKSVTLATPYARIAKGGVVDEDLLLASLPADFLPVPASKVLLALDNTGQDTSRFRSWGKYFDAYSLFVSRGPKL